MAPRAAETSRILFVRNLPFACTGEEVCKIFSRYGAIRQVRLGSGKSTKGTAFIVYNEMHDAKRAYEELAGFNVEGRYLAVLYFHPAQKRRTAGASALEAKRQEVDELRQQFNT